MGKVTTFCQISGCSPETEYTIDSYYEWFVEPLIENAAERESAGRVERALKLLMNDDEKQGHQAISIIGAFHDHEDKPLWDMDIWPGSMEELLKHSETHVRVISDWVMGEMYLFDLGFISSSKADGNSALISFGCCFFVQTYMLPILKAATDGRVSPQRLWELAMARGHFPAHDFYVLPGVDYGPIEEGLDQLPWHLGDIGAGGDELYKMRNIGTPEEIAEVMRKRGFWMWMRPDRFPIDSTTTCKPASYPSIALPSESTSLEPISKLPPEILQSITELLPLHGITMLGILNKRLYHQILGSAETSNPVAKAYIRNQAPWYLPYGEAELKWWNDRDGDAVLGWDYLKRCLTESHSMRNRKRVWKAAESIEEQCQLEEAKRS